MIYHRKLSSGSIFSYFLHPIQSKSILLFKDNAEIAVGVGEPNTGKVLAKVSLP